MLLKAGGRTDGQAAGRVGGRLDFMMHFSESAGQIFSIQSSMELSRPEVVQCHSHLPMCTL